MLVGLLVYWKTGEPIYLRRWPAAADRRPVALLRDMRKYRNAPQHRRLRRGARGARADYILYGAMQGLMLGMFCFVGIYLAPDSFAEIAAICVTLARATSPSPAATTARREW